MGIKQWLRRHRADPESVDPAQYDRVLEQDRREAIQSRKETQGQAAEVRRLRTKSDTVHRGMGELREDNHFGPWLLRSLNPREN